jgi:hypothetical protein
VPFAGRLLVRMAGVSQETINWVESHRELPDADTTVLIFGPGLNDPVWLGYFSGDEWHAADGAQLSPDFTITHWAPMPAGPDDDLGPL